MVMEIPPKYGMSVVIGQKKNYSALFEGKVSLVRKCILERTSRMVSGILCIDDRFE